ncbi:MAG: hypothetical protein IJQ60_16500, partial [Prevotella sp.]|nr:hypothetical protein [Prevotella sp.]
NIIYNIYNLIKDEWLNYCVLVSYFEHLNTNCRIVALSQCRKLPDLSALFLRDEELVALLDAEGVVPGIDLWQGCIDTVLDGGDTVERACRRTKLRKNYEKKLI